jgi:hypothetical protein
MVKRIKFLFPALILLQLFYFFPNVEIFSQETGKISIYRGTCDASAAVALDETTFIAASDEDNELRIYRRNSPDELQRIKLSEVFNGQIQDGNNLEIDIEGAARLGDKIFWIGSHGTGKNGKTRPSRRRLFAITLSADKKGIFKAAAVGKTYTGLISDLEKDSRFDEFQFAERENIKSKDAGGLNIEGLAATPDNHLLIGFRNPSSAGKALIVELINPLKVIEGEKAKFASPILLNLDGFGIRSLEYETASKQYLIVAGAVLDEVTQGAASEQMKSRLYLWSGDRTELPRQIKGIDLAGFNAEAAFFFPKDKRGFFELLSDDGKTNCNNSFRALLQKF